MPVLRGSAPEVSLKVHHIHCALKSGDDDILNLVTICTECNQGKSACATTDDAVVKKRMIRMGELQERRKEIEMVMQWPGLRFDLELAPKYPSLVRVGAGTSFNIDIQ